MAHEHQERYSSLVLAKMRAENILKDGVVFNNDYEGDPVSGAVKVPVRDDEVKVGDYDKSAGGELSESSTVYRPILINREKYVNELIDSYDAASVPDNLVADRLDSAGYSMARTLDSDGASALISQGTRVNLSSISASTVYSEVVGIRKLMSKANVPNDGRRYLLVTPDVYAEMLKSEQFVKASDLGAELIQTGALGRMAGFTVYEWNDSTANLAMIAGHPRYATRVNAWKVPIAVNDLKDGKHIGASAVQGRAVYGHEVLRKSANRFESLPFWYARIKICCRLLFSEYFVRTRLVWQSGGFPFGAEIAKSQSGLVSRDGKLTAVNVYNDEAGTYVVCSELGAPHFVDDVKEKTGAELTLFLDNVRYNTTLLSSSGERNIGTEMSEAIWESVRSGEVYIGKAEINGVNYYVNYTPLNDVNGNTVGAYFAGYSTAEADREIARAVTFSCIAMLILCVLVAFLLYIAMNRLVRKPVAEVVEICGQISSAALDSQDSEFRFADDEMGEIAAKLTDAKRSLHTIVEDISRVLSAMAQGDFSVSPGMQYMGSFEEINRSFRMIQDTLSGIIMNINTSSADVSAGAQQMSDASQLLA